MCSLFAATHPATDRRADHDRHLRAARLRAPDYPWAPTREQREAFFKEIVDNWGGPVGHRRARAERRARSGLPRLVGVVPAHGREPGRGDRAHAHERGDRQHTCN